MRKPMFQHKPIAILAIILGIFCVFPNFGNAQEPNTQYQTESHSLYDQGKFSEALETLEKHGLQSAQDYYNAANSLFRLGKLGKALAYYEKANALSPGNDDIEQNLTLTREYFEKSNVATKDQSFWFGKAVPFLKQTPEWLVHLIFALTSLLLALLFFRAERKATKLADFFVQTPAVFAVLFAWLLTCGLEATYFTAKKVHWATVASDLVTARSGPGETFTELFKVSAGAKVELTGKSKDGWNQIRFSLGNVGWVMEKELLEL